MKNLKLVIFIFLAIATIVSCKSTDIEGIATNDEVNSKYSDTVTIASDKVEYEIIIIEPGFNYWLNSVAQPKGYYTQNFMETRNRIFVQEWNLRTIQPERFDPNLYLLRIDYNPSIDYGYDLNYQLYNYFIYFQLKYKQQLTAMIPRI